MQKYKEKLKLPNDSLHFSHSDTEKVILTATVNFPGHK